MLRRLLAALGSALSLGYCGCSSDKSSRPAIDPARVEWVAEPLPLPADARKPWVDVIRGTAEDDVWVLLGISRGSKPGRLAFHFDGRTWKLVDDIPPRARTAIFPLGGGDVWAAGVQATLAHFDGRAWTSHQMAGSYLDFIDLVALPGGDVWLTVTGPRLVHFDGRGFTLVQPPELRGAGVQHLWHDRRGGLLVPVNTGAAVKQVARFDGQRWSFSDVGPGGITMLHASGPDDIWAASRSDQAYHYDGRGWTRVSTSGARRGEGFYGLWVAGPERAYLVGDRGLILRWNGGVWERSESGTREQLVAVYAPATGAALVGGRGGLWREKRGQ